MRRPCSQHWNTFLTQNIEFWNILLPTFTRQNWIIYFLFGHKLIFIFNLEFADLL